MATPSKSPGVQAAAAPEPARERAYASFDTGFALAEVTRLLRLAFDQRMRNVGLTGSTRRVITYLSRDDGQTQASLAKRLDITRVALGEAVDRLEHSGHVERRPDAADRRKWRVQLTRKSRDLLPEMFAAADQLQAECFGHLSDGELAQLQATLGCLRARLTDITIESPDDEAAE